MKKSTWRKHHKVLGLGLCFFMFMFAMSGIVLNHRPFFSKVNVGRTLLPAYKFSKWNGGLLRGTRPLDIANVLIYGYAGMWLSHNGTVADFNEGLPSYAD